MINVDVTIQHRKGSDKSIKKNFYMADYNMINDFLHTQDWNTILDKNDIDENYAKFLNIIHESIDRFVPEVSSGNKPRLPRHLKALLLKKKQLYKQSKLDSNAKDQYKFAEKAYKKMSREYFMNLENKVLTSGSAKLFFNFINKKLKCRNFIPPLLNQLDDSIVTDAADKAELLNNYFSQCYQNDDQGLDLDQFPPTSVQYQMPSITIEDSDIICSIKKLKNKVSRTPDGIPALYVKSTITNILHPLSILFKQSIAQCKVPSIWKISIIIALPKKGLRSLLSSWRPVAQTSIPCRLLESIVHCKLNMHLIDNNILSKAQHGFVARKSTMTNQMTMLNILTEKFDSKIQTDMILLDFSKAFDMVPHKKLMEIMTYYEVNNDLIRWIKNLFSERTQTTHVDGKFSNKSKVTSGVPQGSVIGPLSFNIYLNPILHKIQSIEGVFVIAFADDVKLISCDPKKLQYALDEIQQCCDIFKLKLNPDKSEHICFRMQQDHTYRICSKDIKKVTTTKDLGVMINNSLKWNLNSTKQSSKATVISFMILRTFNSFSCTPYVSAYKTFVRPHLEYNCAVWNSCNRNDIQILEKVQRVFTRRLLQKLNIKFSSYEERLNILNIEKLDSRRLRNDLVLVYKMLNNLIDMNFNEFFSMINLTYNLRRHKFTIAKPPVAKTNILRQYFKHRIVNVWNSLPAAIVEAESLEIFKYKLKSVRLGSF